MDKKNKLDFRIKELYSLLLPNSVNVKNAAGFLALLTVLGSITAIVCSAYVAERISEYYGVYVNNLDVLSKAKALIVYFGPLVLYWFVVRYIIVFMFKSLFKEYENRSFKTLGYALISLISILLCILCSTWLTGFDEKLTHVFLLLAIVAFVVFIVVSIPEKHFNISIVFVSLIAFGLLFLGSTLFVTSMRKFQDTSNPYCIRSYEIINIDSEDYAIICNSGDNKIAMKCSVDSENNNLELIYGEYRIVKSEDYQYHYHTFDAVYRDIDIST